MGFRPTLFFLTVVVALLVVMRESTEASGHEPHLDTTAASYLKYQAIKGYFLQDDPETDPSTFNYTATNFGLIERSYDSDSSLPNRDALTQWQRFEHELQTLNAHAPKRSSYRLLFLGRHGEGEHNVAEAFYGTKAWDCYWSALPGNSTTTWADAHLTQKGITQALAASRFWTQQHTSQRMPLPQTYYVSPLDRALHTAHISFSSLHPSSSTAPFAPTVKELLREAIGIHTCDRRSSRSHITQHYPRYKIEQGFAEEDPFWIPDRRESNSALTARLDTLLDDVLSHDHETFISMTSHGGAIGALLRVVGHRPFSLATGAVIPVLLEVQRVRGKKPEVELEPWTPKPDCSD